jgi:hypothetical protein
MTVAAVEAMVLLATLEAPPADLPRRFYAEAAKVIDNHGELQVTTGATLGFLAALGYTWWRPRQRRRITTPRFLRTVILER